MRALWLVAFAACAPKTVDPGFPVDDPGCFEALATALSDDAMEGRGIGTAGLERAADLVAASLTAAVGGDGAVRRQPFEVVTGVALGEGNALSDGEDDLAVGEAWTPFGFSASGAFSGELVFAGYGIRAPELGYDDYADVDVAGRVALVFRYEPGEDDEDSPFDGRRPTRHSDLRYKAFQAREAGAAALVVVTPPGSADDPDILPALKVDGPTSDAGIPVLAVTRAVADRWLATAGTDVAGLAAAIDADFRPRSRPLDVAVSGRVVIDPTRAPVENVVAVIPGAGALADEVVVVGAHYDHLGYGGSGSLRPGVHAIHNGADDNASGTAALVCSLPAIRRRTAGRDRRTLVAVAFTAEEIGLGGSAWYVEDPVEPLEDTVAMVNLDMVGRVRDGRLRVMGTDTSPVWDGWVRSAAEEAGLVPELGGDGYGPSDHMSFYGAGVPVVHLFSGAHDDYHTPDDDADRLNVEGGRRVTALTAALVSTALTAPHRPAYVASTAGPVVGDSRGFGAYLGTVPDYTTMTAAEGGVLLSAVRAGGPADRAGLRGGDVIVEVGGVEIRNLYDLTFVLRERRPGESVAITVLRDGEPVELLATLGRRGEAPSGPHGGGEAWTPSAGRDASHLLDPREVHLADLRQLTFGGDNAEAYWSPDGRKLVFQRTPPASEGGGCDQQYVLDLDTGEVVRVSSGEGRTTCGYFTYPTGEGLIWSTTRFSGPACPPPPDRSRGYVWPLYDFDLVRTVDGGVERFLSSDGYDAEATVCMTDGRIVFTSTRDGDLDLYVANADGSGLTRITDTPGYDGGAFFTPDCSEIVWRASRPTGQALDEYRALLADGLVRPGHLEIFMADADGSNVRQLTENGAANFGPYPLPDGSGVIFSSNVGDDPREFDLYVVGREGGDLERITYTPEFDGFPVFSPDGRWLVFGSNRGGTDHETNLFLARWVP